MGKIELNGNWRLIIQVATLLGAGLIAFGALRSDISALKTEVDRKANREVVEVQYQIIIGELRDIKERLRALEKP
ncbi:MAG: hypothetical protein KatS3mg109_2082 [Pirellulaceae bacterium]|nr:MAG: hypothetical protein KatS3mg109_0375 [Pirellulaceae bacterium]GIW91550.1 MAG: hypothetical protein KatS3mg109_1982 [Pirellulaceae bacterium]GIW91650.1 MAG: hypothetical protein KatS3mg109_2082 [Pirellulaceae bacterium]